jgi:hypothetical protein
MPKTRAFINNRSCTGEKKITIQNSVASQELISHLKAISILEGGEGEE